MNVAQLCSRDAVTVRPFDEIDAAARLMRERHVGYLVVMGPEPPDGAVTRPIGVLTDRDIVVGVVAHGLDPRSVVVKDIMTRDPQVIDASDSIVAGIELMRRIGVRRMPVVDQEGALFGVLSFDDVFDALSSELTNLAGAIRNERRIETALRA